MIQNRDRSSILTSQETYFTEKEVNRLITSCNYTLNNISMEHDYLKDALIDHKFETNAIQKETQKQLAKLHKIKGECDDFEYLLNLKYDVLTKLKTITDSNNLEQTLINIQNEIKQLEDSPIMWKCIRCGFSQKEGENEPSCTYHPGLLKYYSCRQCGQDEYFTCCNKCRDCVYGCRKGLHRP